MAPLKFPKKGSIGKHLRGRIAAIVICDLGALREGGFRKRDSLKSCGKQEAGRETHCHVRNGNVCALSGSEKGIFWKRGLFRKVHFLEILEILENPQTLENKEESDHVLEILENLEILEILDIPSVKRPLS